MNATPPLVHIRGVRLGFGGKPLFAGVDFTLSRGERAALVGANGAGKSTLLQVIAGAIEPDAGSRYVAPRARLALALQEQDFAGHATVRDAARSMQTWQLDDHVLDATLFGFDLDPERGCSGLSGGEARRLALAAAFAGAPDIVLLDEPTNHLDIPAIEALEERLASFRGAVLLISHDRRFLEAVSTTTLWLRQGEVLRHDGGFAGFDAWAEQLEQAESRALATLETHLAAETRWYARGVTARRRRNEGRVRKLQALRADRSRLLGQRRGAAELSVDTAGASGRLVFDAHGVTKAWGRQAPVVRDLKLRVLRGDRLGIVGPNGAGKSTLLDLLIGRTPPDTGEVRQGTGLKIAYFDQRRSSLSPDKTLWDTFAPGGGDQILVRGEPRHVATYAADFLFAPSQLRQPVASLSGGERNRLTLAIALAKPANVLVLDEPTNDLDMETLDLLEDMLAGFDGTIVLVSHDRAFLDAVATSVVWPAGDGRWRETPGGYADYLRERATAADIKSAPVKTATRNSARDPVPAIRQSRKLSYKDERRLSELERLLPETEARISALEGVLADPEFYARTPESFTRASDTLARTRAELAALEEEWLTLEDRRSALSDTRA
jgi:ATP-binding cassette subfamily F protein uup